MAPRGARSVFSVERRDLIVRWIVPTLAGALFAIAVCANGVPELRHDWDFTNSREGVGSYLSSLYDGWIAIGLGRRSPYPTSFLTGIVLSAPAKVLSPLLLLACFSFLVGFACAWSAIRLGLMLGAGRLAACALGGFALANPWVYSETVAGHLIMILAYAGVLLFASEVLKAKPSELAVALTVPLLAQQHQFFILCAIPIAAYTVATKRIVPALTALFFAAPSFLGVLSAYQELRSRPYLLPWQQAQSVDLSAGVTLNGYFTHYADAFGRGVTQYALVFCVAIALVGAVRSLWNPRLALVTVATIVLLLASTGTRGPIGMLYALVVTAVPESGLFRELYDLIGLVAVGYVVLAAVALTGMRLLAVPFSIAIVCIAAQWWVCAPDRQWVSSRGLPTVSVEGPPRTRFLLLPPFQPLSYGTKGSGADPDAYPRGDGLLPVNEYFPTYPVNSAIGTFLRTGDVRDLESLSVAGIVRRPWLRTDEAQLAQQWVGSPAAFSILNRQPVPRRALHPLPLLGLSPPPAIGSLVNRPGAGNVLFADLSAPAAQVLGLPSAQSPGLSDVRPQNSSLDPMAAWVDGRLAFTLYPAMAQGFGGAFTRSTRSALAVTPGTAALVYGQGALTDLSGRPLARLMGRYVWTAIPESVAAVRCRGACIVAALASRMPAYPLNPPPNPEAALTFSDIAPWALASVLPPHTAGLLRYNTRYDPFWVAQFLGQPPLAHVRVDAVMNGWAVPASSAPARVIIYNAVALLQFVLEAAALVWYAGLLATALAPSLRAAEWSRRTSRSPLRELT